jgi:hypothetical protein
VKVAPRRHTGGKVQVTLATPFTDRSLAVVPVISARTDATSEASAGPGCAADVGGCVEEVACGWVVLDVELHELPELQAETNSPERKRTGRTAPHGRHERVITRVCRTPPDGGGGHRHLGPRHMIGRDRTPRSSVASCTRFPFVSHVR